MDEIMESIFRTRGRRNKKNVYQQVITLKRHGLSMREIAERLKIPKSSAWDIFKKFNSPQETKASGTVRECPELSEKLSESSEKSSELSESEEKETTAEGKDSQNLSVADLKLKINTILRDIYNILNKSKERLKVLEEKQDTMEEEFSSRINRVLCYHLKNAVEPLIEHKLKTLIEEDTKRL